MMIGGVSTLIDHRREVVDGLGHCQVRDDVGVLAQGLDLDLEARVGGRQDREALAPRSGGPSSPSCVGSSRGRARGRWCRDVDCHS